ncbi:unnamed protein product [Dracunculus medinensis]|uniref:NADPH--hemoprotein reductase n=1 Tax=Dracunculus medinensis TaxID=318479 RepID=A0A158Q432_DRAME|nr:unnamed protein product [Dracunculus medinensis]
MISTRKTLGSTTLILYGSQTGTAEELAGRLSKDIMRYGKKAILLDPEEMNVEEFSHIAEIPNAFIILCMATYGEGNPTDNAQELHEYISNNEMDLSGVRYAIFGLGNKTYEHYNEMGKFFDRKLEEFGATRIYELGLGDDDGNLEEDFMRWREGFWPAVIQSFGWELSNEIGSERQYRCEFVTEPSTVLFTGEYGFIGAFTKQRPPFDSKNPFLATIAVNRELHKEKSERSCRHIEFDTSAARIRYEAGDHLGVFPENNKLLVEELCNLLNANMNEALLLINLDEESSKRNPFPCPCTIRTAFTHYVDICAPVKSHVLKAISEYTTDEEQKQKLVLMSTPNEEGLKAYSNFIQKERRSIIDVLRYFNKCKPPVDHLLELLPRLQYMIGDRLIKGVCTNYLLTKMESEKIPIFVRKSTVRLPHKLSTPVIMIGPGTGLAPFRGFLQERSWQKQQGKEIGPISLYFGCRYPDHDFIYEEELKQFVTSGILSELHLAFSRIGEKKVYVQHKLWENREAVWHSVENSAHIYVCGDARNMARDVQATFIKIFMQVGQKSESEAHKLFKELERQRRYQADNL